QVAPGEYTSDSLGVSLDSLLHAMPTTGQDAEIKAWLQEPILPGGADTGPLDLRFTDGRFYQVHAQRLESGQIAVLFHDISRLKSYQSQAIQASKLALLGELSTSVAHEINQPLSAIQLTCDNIKRHLESGQEVDREFLLTRTERAKTALDKARNIVDQLRRFGRNAKEAPTAVDLNESINNALDLVSQQMIAAGIVVELQVPSYSVHVMGHPIQLEQVILNLLANARDAVAEGVEAPCITVALTRDTDSVELRVSDNGPGVPEGMREAIFEAFFTSKEVGKGTGLGLSVSKGIVREFGGSLELDTSSHGATFIVKLPNVPEPSPTA
ncbi:MAG: sensor histidine kinase, partial [Luminiphilus sp.]